MSEYVCMRCLLRQHGKHGCQDRACNCCFGEFGDCCTDQVFANTDGPKQCPCADDCRCQCGGCDCPTGSLTARQLA
jgi:hypothetical protein